MTLSDCSNGIVYNKDVIILSCLTVLQLPAKGLFPASGGMENLISNHKTRVFAM